MDFGNTLKELRLQAGLTQSQLASQIGVTKSAVSYYEIGSRIPSPEILVKLSSVLHVSADYLLGIEKTRNIDITGLDSNDEKLVRLVIETLRKKNRK